MTLPSGSRDAGDVVTPLEVDAITFDFYNTLAFHRSGRGRGAEVMSYLEVHGLASDPWEHQVLYDLFERHDRDYVPERGQTEHARYIRGLAGRLFERLNIRQSEADPADHADAIWRLLGPEAFGVFPEVPAVLRRLRAAGYRLAIVSNWQRGLAHFCIELGIAPWFAHVLSSAEVGFAKPDPEIFLMACRRLQADPGRVLHVGDTLVDDVEGATGAGMPVALVCRGGARPAIEVPVLGDLSSLVPLLGPS